MRNRNNNPSNNAVVNPTHLELGLLLSTYIMYKYNKEGMQRAYKLLAENIDAISIIEEDIETLMLPTTKQLNGELLLCCGFESIITDYLSTRYTSMIIVPNSADVDFERIAGNYNSKTMVATPLIAADLICPDTSILVPIFPLDDGTYLTYNYSSKLISVDARKNSYQIVGLEICSPLPIQYGYDPSGLLKVLSPIDPSYFTDFLKLNTNHYELD